MKTSEQLFLSISVAVVLVLVVVIGSRQLVFNANEHARAERIHAEKIERAQQMVKSRDEARASDALRKSQDEARWARENLEEKLSHYGTALRDYARAHPGTEEYWDVAAARKIRIGMPAELAEMAWGRPEHINDTIVGRGKHSQWVYSSGSYIYVENGEVTAIQTTH